MQLPLSFGCVTSSVFFLCVYVCLCVCFDSLTLAYCFRPLPCPPLLHSCVPTPVMRDLRVRDLPLPPVPSPSPPSLPLPFSLRFCPSFCCCSLPAPSSVSHNATFHCSCRGSSLFSCCFSHFPPLPPPTPPQHTRERRRCDAWARTCYSLRYAFLCVFAPCVRVSCLHHSPCVRACRCAPSHSLFFAWSSGPRVSVRPPPDAHSHTFMRVRNSFINSNVYIAACAVD